MYQGRWPEQCLFLNSKFFNISNAQYFGCKYNIQYQLLCYSSGSSSSENLEKLLKVAWGTLPLGLIVTAVACYLVLWWQELSYSEPYAKAVLINGNFAAATPPQPNPKKKLYREAGHARMHLSILCEFVLLI